MTITKTGRAVRTAQQFMDKFRGVPTHHVTEAFSACTPGIIWSKCSKAHMAEAWANPKRPMMQTITLDMIAAKVRK